MRLPSPQRLGLPPKFAEWRRPQEHAIMALIDSEFRFSGLSMPTGSGKSGVAMGLAQLLPKDDRVLIITSTRHLQGQLGEDFYTTGLRDIQGKSNYVCKAASSGGELVGTTDSHTPEVMVDHAPCFVANAECSLKLGGCGWFDAHRAARSSRIVSTNYAKWIATPNWEEELGKFDWLICDEAGDAEQWLTSALNIELRRGDVESLLHVAWPAGSGVNGIGSTRLSDWTDWARHHKPAADSALKTCEGQLRDALAGSRGAAREVISRLGTLRKLATALGALRSLRGNWVLDDLKAYDRVIGATFDAVWPAPYSPSMLFRGIPRVVLMGATLVEKHLDILGVPRDEREFISYPSTFAVARRPIVYVKLDPPLKLNWKTEQDVSVQRRVAALGDELIAARQDRNGIVHSGSYKRGRYIHQFSEFRDQMMTHVGNSDATRAAVRMFKQLADDPPHQLVSPAVTTGVDFPGCESEWCWIPKLPFEPPDSALMRARCEIDPEYADFRVAEKVSQAVGRIMRAPWDSGESIVTDAAFGYHPWKFRHLYAKSVIDAIRRSDGPPRPPPKLVRPRDPT